MQLPAFSADLSFAREMDAGDPLAAYQQQFHFPEVNGKQAIYFCGNSLGLQPVSVEAAIGTELETWRKMGVAGYMAGPHPWLYYQDECAPGLAHIMGAQEQEVTVMNALTVNLHLLMLTFYRPTSQRYKIIMEAGAFPSDQYAVETQVKHYGFEPADAIVEVAPRPGEKLLHTDDILQTIRAHGQETALVLFSGIQYYTGQLFPVETITREAHQVGAIAGFDLAHVAGNVPMQLHDWKVDFAVWCSYKYLNGGPGAVGGIFIHEKHAVKEQPPRMAGWWGNPESTRFRMEKGFVPKPGASGWCVSTAQVFNTVCLRASLQMFLEAGMDNIRRKSVTLTAYLQFLLGQVSHLPFRIITPESPEERGAQLSLFFPENGRRVHDAMQAAGVVVDYREPGVIRVAPAPLYCSFSDVFRFFEILQNIR